GPNRGSCALRATASGRWLGVGGGGTLETSPTAGAAQRFSFTMRHGCLAYPEAGTSASGNLPRPVNKDGTVFGYADPHLHITADLRAGGEVLSGESFDRFGIT